MRTGWVASLIFLSAATAAADPPNPEVVVRPEPATGPVDNPLKGWCPYPDAGPIHQPYSMVFLYVSWKELEPRAGRFEFEKWERRAWSVPEADGKHVVLRPYIDYPSKPSGLPDWLLGEVKMTAYEDHGGGVSPDYENPRLIAAMERLIEAMGRRYDENPRVAFLELGLLGFWGEWHTWPRDALHAQPETERRIIDAYHRAFPHKILMARYARGHAGTQAWLGFHDDLFPEDTDNGQDWSFLAKLRRSGRDRNWERAAIGGEMVPLAARRWLGADFDRTIQMAERGHFSWVGPYGPALENAKEPEFQRKSEALVEKLGYQFRLVEIRHLKEFRVEEPWKVTIRGENVGVAPFYYPWPVELALLDESGKVVARSPFRSDIRSWLPGPFEVEGRFAWAAPPGRYKLALGVIDPWTNRPAIGFANGLSMIDGWTLLSEVVVPKR